VGSWESLGTWTNSLPELALETHTIRWICVSFISFMEWRDKAAGVATCSSHIPVHLRIKTKTMENIKFVIVRTYSAGVFAGFLESREGKEVVLRNARRLWYWQGAATLSQLAMEGTTKPDVCKFPCSVDRVILTEAIEILDVTDNARKSIECVPVWKA